MKTGEMQIKNTHPLYKAISDVGEIYDPEGLGISLSAVNNGAHLCNNHFPAIVEDAKRLRDACDIVIASAQIKDTTEDDYAAGNMPESEASVHLAFIALELTECSCNPNRIHDYEPHDMTLTHIAALLKRLEQEDLQTDIMSMRDDLCHARDKKIPANEIDWVGHKGTCAHAQKFLDKRIKNARLVLDGKASEVQQ